MNGAAQSAHTKSSGEMSTGLRIEAKLCNGCKKTRSLAQFLGQSDKCKQCIRRKVP